MASRIVDRVPIRPHTRPIRYSVSEATTACAVAMKLPLALTRAMISTPVTSNTVKKYISPANRAYLFCERSVLRAVTVAVSVWGARRYRIGGIACSPVAHDHRLAVAVHAAI